MTLTVTPSDGLGDGQAVTVTGSGFPPNASGTIRECGGTLTAAECDVSVNVPFVTTASGDIPPTAVTVKRIITPGTTTFNCGAQSCALVASAGGRTSQHHIRMAAAGTSVPVTPPVSSPLPNVSPVPGLALACAVLRSVVEPFPFLRSLITTLSGVIGCP